MAPTLARLRVKVIQRPLVTKKIRIITRGEQIDKRGRQATTNRIIVDYYIRYNEFINAIRQWVTSRYTTDPDKIKIRLEKGNIQFVEEW
jgi:hypothetical protein